MGREKFFFVLSAKNEIKLEGYKGVSQPFYTYQNTLINNQNKGAPKQRKIQVVYYVRLKNLTPVNTLALLAAKRKANSNHKKTFRVPRRE